MLIATILVLVLIIGLIIWGRSFTIKYFERRFQKNPFSLSFLLLWIVSVFAVIAGVSWRRDLIIHHGDVLNGTLLIAAGIGIAVFLVIRNIKLFGGGFGTLAIALQLISAPVLLFWMPLSFFFHLAASEEAGSAAHRKRSEQEWAMIQANKRMRGE
ncbi:MAG: hypothetical protein ACXU8A_09355 [Burkholderiaceae bacterium]